MATEAWETLYLRDEIKKLQYEVAELREWKRKSTEFMTRMAPKRNQIRREKEETLLLRRKMKKIHIDVEKRALLEQTIDDLQHQLKTQRKELEAAEYQYQTLEEDLENEIHQHHETTQRQEQLITVLHSVLGQLLLLVQKDSVTTLEQAQDLIENQSDVVQFAQETLSWLETHPSASKESKELEKAQEMIQQLEHNVKVEKGVNAALRKHQADKEMYLSDLETELKRAHGEKESESECLQRLQQDTKQFIQLMQSETKKKYGYSGLPSRHHELSKRVSLAMNHLDKYRINL